MSRARGRARQRDIDRAVQAALTKAIHPGAMANMARNTGTQPRGYALADAINAATSQASRDGGFYGMLDFPRDPRDTVAFGPMAPLPPAPIDPARTDTHRPEPRVTEYPVAWNLPGNGSRLIPWSVLYAASENVDILRRCIEIRKRHLRGLEWSFTVSENVIAEAYRADPAKGRDDIERELREEFLPEIARMREFWAKPWRANGLSFGQWLNGVVDQHLVLDGVAIYPQMTYGGDVTDLMIIDASTIKPLLDINGQRPRKPYPAFQQILYGFPRGEFQATYTQVEGQAVIEGGYAADELYYHRENFRPQTQYGYSPTEQALISARLYLKRQGWMLAEYDDGSTPLMWLVPEGTATMQDKLTARQRRQWEDSLNDELTGQTAARHRVKLTPPGFMPIPMPDASERYKPDYDMHLIKLLASHYGVTISELGFTESKGLGSTGFHEGQADVEDRVGLRPDKAVITEIINDLSRDFLRCPPEVSFTFIDPKGEDTTAEDTVANAQRLRGTITLNEDRKRLGKAPLALPEADMPMLIAGDSATPLEGLLETLKAAAAQQQEQHDASIAATEQPAEEGAPTDTTKAVDGHEAIAAEVGAYRRWARKGNAGRPFHFKAAEPGDVTAWGLALDPDRMTFEEWVYVEEADLIGKAYESWWPRDPRGRWLPRAHLGSVHGPENPGKEVLAGLARDAGRVRDASRKIGGMEHEESPTLRAMRESADQVEAVRRAGVVKPPKAKPAEPLATAREAEGVGDVEVRNAVAGAWHGARGEGDHVPLSEIRDRVRAAAPHITNAQMKAHFEELHRLGFADIRRGENGPEVALLDTGGKPYARLRDKDTLPDVGEAARHAASDAEHAARNPVSPDDTGRTPSAREVATVEPQHMSASDSRAYVARVMAMSADELNALSDVERRQMLANLADIPGHSHVAPILGEHWNLPTPYTTYAEYRGLHAADKERFQRLPAAGQERVLGDLREVERSRTDPHNRRAVNEVITALEAARPYNPVSPDDVHPAPTAEHPQKAVFDKLLDGGLVRHKQSRQIVEQLEAHGWELTGQNPMLGTTQWRAPDGRELYTQFLTDDKPKFYAQDGNRGALNYRDALAHVVTPTHEEVGGPNMPAALRRVSPGLDEQVRGRLFHGTGDASLEPLVRASRQLSGYGSTPKRPHTEVVADLRAQAERAEALAASNAESAARFGTGEPAMVRRQRDQAAQFRQIADVLEQQHAERQAYEAERDRRAALPLDIRPGRGATPAPVTNLPTGPDRRAALVRNAEAMYGTDRSKWPRKALDDLARLERKTNKAAGVDDPKADAPAAADERWPGWAVDLAVAAAGAAALTAALDAAIPTEVLAAAFAAWSAAWRKGDPVPDVEAWLSDQLGLDYLAGELEPALSDIHAEGALVGHVSALAVLDAAADGQDLRVPFIGGGALDDGEGGPAAAWSINWHDWEPGHPEAARRVLSEDGVQVRLQELLDRDGITIKTIAQGRLDELAAVLADGLEQGHTPHEIATALRGIVDDPDWAYLTALTETNRATSAATLDAYEADGVPGKSWMTAFDQRVCPICKANEAQGAIALGERFSSGTLHPPGHPRCRCSLLPEFELSAAVVKALAAAGAGRGGGWKAYWTHGEGLAKWAKSPHPWTALYHHLVKHMPPPMAKRVASQWFHDVTGMWPGERKGKNPVGRG